MSVHTCPWRQKEVEALVNYSSLKGLDFRTIVARDRSRSTVYLIVQLVFMLTKIFLSYTVILFPTLPG